MKNIFLILQLLTNLFGLLELERMLVRKLLVIFVDIYAAREKNTFGVSSSALAERIGERASYANDFKAAADALASELRVGDVAVVMGAGDIYKVFDYLPFTEE